MALRTSDESVSGWGDVMLGTSDESFRRLDEMWCWGRVTRVSAVG